MPKLVQLSRAQAHNALRQFEADLSPAVRSLAQQLLALLDDEGSTSVKAVHDALFPLAETTAAAAQLSTLTKKLEMAAANRRMSFKTRLSGSKQGGVAQRRIGFTAPRSAPVADTEGLDAIDPASRIAGQLSIPLGPAPILLLTYNEHEFNAIRDKFWPGAGTPSRRGSGAEMVDDLGELNGWPILHGHSRQGNREAQRSVDTLRRAHSPYAIISVGIAFGLDEGKQSIGDVLVSKYLIDYEAGRVSPTGIDLRGSSPPATRRLVQGLEQLDIRSKSQTGWPMLRIGGMLSGEKLVDELDYRDSLVALAKRGDLVGGEMESIGLFTALDDTGTAWVVVKAICDFADGNKNNRHKEQHQRHAAQNAAQVVHALLASGYLAKPTMGGGQDGDSPVCAPASTAAPASAPARIRERLRHDAHALGCDELNISDQLANLVSLENLPDGAPPADCPKTIAFDHLLQWLGDANAPPLYALLGEYGMGKTTHCQTLTRYLEEQREQAATDDGGNALPAPLYFDLRKVEQIAAAQNGAPGHVATLEETINDCLRNGYLQQAGSHHTYQDVLDVIDEGALVIFDGLDEVLSRITDQQGLKFTANLLKVLPEARMRQRAGGRTDAQLRLPKVLLSCRTQFFRNLAEQNSHLTGEHRSSQPASQYRASVLQAFSDEQIRKYLTAALPGQDVDELMQMVASIHNLRELAGRPFTLKLVAQFIPLIRSWQKQGKTITGATLYREVAREWLLRDKEKQSFQLEDKVRLASDLAAHLWRSGQRGIRAKALEDWLDAWLSQLPPHASVLQKPRELLHQDVRNATFLKRNDGEDLDDSRFEFAHTSLQEFFLAQYLFDALQRAAEQPAGQAGPGQASARQHWAMPRPGMETLDFLGQMLAEQGPGGAALRALSRWRSPYAKQASELQLAYALRAWQRGWPVPVTVGSDLQGADLTEWHFGSVQEPGVQAETAQWPTPQGAQPQGLAAQERGQPMGAAAMATAMPAGAMFDLSGSNFSAATLRRSRFWQVRLDRANFTGALLAQSEFLHCSQVGSQWQEGDTTGWVQRPAAATLAPALAAPLPLAQRVLQLAQAHLGGVNCCAFSPDGLQVLSGAWDNTLKLWDANTATCLRTWQAHGAGVITCAFSADGQYLASGSEDGTLKLWHAATGAWLRSFAGHTERVTVCAFSPNGLYLLSASYDGSLKLWCPASATCLHSFTGHEGGVMACAFAPDGQQVLSGGSDDTLKLWHTTNGDCLQTFVGHQGTVYACTFAPGGQQVLSGAWDDNLKLWDVASGTCLQSFTGHQNTVTCCAFAPDGRQVLSGSWDRTLKLWDAASGECLRTWHGHRDWVNACAFAPDGRQVLSASDDQTLRLWQLDSTACLLQFAKGAAALRTGVLMPDGLQWLSASNTGSLKLWQLATGAWLRSLPGNGSGLGACAISPDGRQVLAADDDGDLHLLDLASGTCLQRIAAHQHGVLTCAFSPDGQHWLSGGWDNTLKLWDAASATCLHSFGEHKRAVRACAFAPDGQQVLSGDGDGSLTCWDTASGAMLQDLAGHRGGVNACAFSPDGQQALSGADDATLKLWQLATGTCSITFSGHGGPVLACAFSPNGQQVLSASDDGSVKLWDAGTGTCQMTFAGHEGRVRACAFVAQGSQIISASIDDTLRLWDSATGTCLRIMLDVPGGSAAWEPATNTLLHASGTAWRYLRWEGQDEQGNRHFRALEY
jgi:WD40 repeat protein/nucleoside phosphorylase